MSQTILIVEDDPDICDLIEIHLNDIGYDLDRAADGEAGLDKIQQNSYALIILDLMLPKLDGLEVCKRTRELDKQIPIVMLTSKSEELDKVLGLELGADDYITKPFSVRELTARVKALLRRAGPVTEPTDEAPRQLDYGHLSIDLENRKVLGGGVRIDLTAKEFELLALLASHPGRTYSRDELLDLIWGVQFSGYEHTVNSHISRLRSKIEPDPSNPVYILRVWGVGYRFAESEELEGAQSA
jgi:two-component system, OmpR family, alkaline phosphatase synthesis response regulator PhoP